MTDLRGELRNASDAPPSSMMPCFSGFGLPLCTQQAADTEGYSNGGWQPHMPPKFDVRGAALCLQCCSAGGALGRQDWHGDLDDNWSVRCTTGHWTVTVPESYERGSLLKMNNPFTGVPTPVTVPRGKGAGQTFRILVGEMPRRSPWDRWEFRFLKRESEDDLATLVRCPLQRRNSSAYIAGYSLHLTVTERSSGAQSWTGVDACTATAFESATAPAFTMETIQMNQDVAPLASSAVIGLFFVMAAIGSLCSWVVCPERVRALRKKCREHGKKQLAKLKKSRAVTPAAPANPTLTRPTQAY